jgi:hypothetical protein
MNLNEMLWKTGVGLLPGDAILFFANLSIDELNLSEWVFISLLILALLLIFLGLYRKWCEEKTEKIKPIIRQYEVFSDYLTNNYVKEFGDIARDPRDLTGGVSSDLFNYRKTIEAIFNRVNIDKGDKVFLSDIERCWSETSKIMFPDAKRVDKSHYLWNIQPHFLESVNHKIKHPLRKYRGVNWDKVMSSFEVKG